MTVEKMFSVAFLSQGQLFCKIKDKEVCEIESRYAQEVISRTQQMQESHGWKSRKPDNGLFGGQMLWGKSPSPITNVHPQVSGITINSTPYSLIYALDMQNVGGIFGYKIVEKEENRFFHQGDLYVEDLNHNLVAGLVLYSQHYENGCANIGILNKKNSRMRSITEGDTLDQAPSWVNNGTTKIIFQSAEIGRDANGYIMGYSPFVIEEVDLENKKLHRILENSEYDLLCPKKVNADLYFIRRPYELVKKGNPLSFLGDFILFPFRLLRAFFHFLNFFSLTYSGKPLSTAGAPKKLEKNIKDIILAGKRIEAEKMLQKAKNSKEMPSLVPSSWQLIRKNAEKETVIARQVLSYDVNENGDIVYSNGSSVFFIDSDQKETKLCQHRLIEKVIFLNE